jgi:hypothetical protein
MNYMDAFTMDLERMEECSMYVTLSDGRLVPFCSYQLTNCAGERVFSPWGMPTDEHGAVAWIAVADEPGDGKDLATCRTCPATVGDGHDSGQRAGGAPIGSASHRVTVGLPSEDVA